MEQLKKYDDNLTGWKNTVSKHDLTVITDMQRSFRFWEYINKSITKGTISSFKCPFSMLEFVRKQDQSVFYTLRRIHGTITNVKLNTMLNEVVGIPARNLVQKLSRIRFYDSKPPVIYTMNIIWDHIFKEIPKQEEYREAFGKKTMSIDVVVREITDELKKNYCPQENTSVLLEVWVKEALDTLVRVGLAKRHKVDTNKYSIKYHRVKGGMTTEFLLAKLYGGKDMKMEEFFE